ncbi:hypothetical protein [Robinsoniella peoriensis]|uniref:hypothetical protein n=1 Tax=Robinsoniella peoriensis TaxID=180332 RepID=UPI00085C3FDA|nr:hypothetical protein [Robinsoniella peoriensis]
MKFEKTFTNRGFETNDFRDACGELCNIQRSSSAGKIWIGTHDPNPKQLASKTLEGGTGWVNYKLPNDVLINHRMHLTRKQSISLAFKLLKFGLFNKI